MAEHAAAVWRNDARSQVATHSTRSSHTFKFDEAEILARSDNRVSRDLLESWFTGHQSINKCNDLSIPYEVLRLRLDEVIFHARSAQVNPVPDARVAWKDAREEEYSDKTDKFSSTSEAIWLSIKLPGSPSLDVLTVYRPLRWDHIAGALLLEELAKFATRPDIQIMGDFDALHIDRSSAHAISSEQTFDVSLVNTTLKLFLTPHVMFPTGVREGQQVNCLDHVLTKSQDSTGEMSCLPSLAEGENLTEGRAKADHLLKFFRSVFSREAGFNPPTSDFEEATVTETAQFTETLVMKERMKLKESLSPGHGEIRVEILKEFAGESAKPLVRGLMPVSRLEIRVDYAAV
nr:unnamed protein product [Spirometra erinaceieuropaei]